MNLNKFNLKFSTRAVKDLRRIRKKIPQIYWEVNENLNKLTSDPFSGKWLSGDKKGCFSLRAGDYRIIYRLYPLERDILVIRVGHRREIYR